jgi:hypothetical protein
MRLNQPLKELLQCPASLITSIASTPLINYRSNAAVMLHQEPPLSGDELLDGIKIASLADGSERPGLEASRPTDSSSMRLNQPLKELLQCPASLITSIASTPLINYRSNAAVMLHREPPLSGYELLEGIRIASLADGSERPGLEASRPTDSPSSKTADWLNKSTSQSLMRLIDQSRLISVSWA